MILPITQQARFFKLFDMATMYAHQVMHVVDDDEFFSPDDPMHPVSEVGQRETTLELWRNPDVLADLVRLNPFKLPKRELDILESWQQAYTSVFSVDWLPGAGAEADTGKARGKAARGSKAAGELVFCAGDHAFAVCGLTRGIEAMLTSVPAVVETTLLPFEDKIVYAMFMAEMPLEIGPNMRKTLDHELADAVASGRVVRTGQELVDVVPSIQQADMDYELDRFRHDMEMEERAQGPLEGQHRGVLANMDEEERERAIREHMREAVLDGDSQSRLLKALDEVCLPGEPTDSLEEMLRLEMEANDIDGSILMETDLADMQDPEFLQELISFAGTRQIELLRELANRGGRWHVDSREFKSLGEIPTPIAGVCSYFHDGDDYVGVMSREVLGAIQGVDWDAAIAFCSDRQNLLRYVEALLELRGIVTVRDAIAAYQEAYPQGLKDAALAEDLIYESLDSLDFADCMIDTLTESYVLHYALMWERAYELGAEDPKGVPSYAEGELGEGLQNLLDRQRGKDPRPLTLDMMKDGSCFDWLASQPPAVAMRDYLDAHVPDVRDDYFFADKVIDELLEEIRWGDPQVGTKRFFEILDANDFQPDESQLNRLVELWMNMCNGLPNWPNNGWSPNELHRRMSGGKVFYNPDGSTMRVGRNDPCPCGSGKKFKRCCGRRQRM